MRNKKALAAGALMVPALALTGGIAYASSIGSHPASARPAVTTVQAHGQHPTGHARHDRCDWRCGDHQGDRRGHSYQRHTAQRHVYRDRSHRSTYSYQGYGQYSSRGYQGSDGGRGHDGGDCR